MKIRCYFYELCILLIFLTSFVAVKGEAKNNLISNFSEKLSIHEIADQKSFKVQTQKLKYKLDVGKKFIVLAEHTQTPLALVELIYIKEYSSEQIENIFYVLKIFDDQIIQVGDHLIPLDLSSQNENYQGATQLLIRSSLEKKLQLVSRDNENQNSSKKSISARYRPLYTQGILAGDTADTLEKDEFLVSYLGQIFYGFYDCLSLGTTVAVNAAGGLNAYSKLRLLNSKNNTLATGVSFTRVPGSTQSNLNLSFLWDSYSNDSMITHNYLSLAVLSYDKAEDSTAIKSFASSSIQSGYEFILKNWDRILVGPNYNFEKKSIGGYLSYVSVWDHLHLHLSLNTIDVRANKLSYTDGYYFFMDLYWRY